RGAVLGPPLQGGYPGGMSSVHEPRLRGFSLFGLSRALAEAEPREAPSRGLKARCSGLGHPPCKGGPKTNTVERRRKSQPPDSLGLPRLKHQGGCDEDDAQGKHAARRR